MKKIPHLRSLNSLTPFFTIMSLLLSIVAYTQTTRYVKQGGNGNGTSWANASGNLQDMITASATNDLVWVAAGTYLPTVAPGNGTNNRDKAFLLKNNVKVYGGFPATGSPMMADRNWTLNETILSGDLGTAGSTADNAYHVVIAAAAEGNAMSVNTIFDGFTVSGGNANGNPFAYITVNGTSAAPNDGGGIYMQGGAATVNNCKIINNAAASNGGGMYLGGSAVMASNVAFTQNNAMYGGGIFEEGVSTLSLDHTKVNGNTAMYGGGGVKVNYSVLTAVNSVFSGNAAFTVTGAGTDGGAINAGNYAETTLTNVTISGNKCNGYGGGVYNLGATLTVQNTLVYGNSSGIYNNVYDANETPFTYTNSLIQLVHDYSAGIILYNDANPLLTNAPAYTTSPFADGDYSISSSCSPVIDAGNNSFLPASATTDFVGNTRFYAAGTVDIGAVEYQGAIFNLPPTVLNQTFDYGATV
ncbi:MAG: choice-of-anchor Q domain-containing protein, partial [Bacteroidota bacterium]